ncbi:MAG: PHP domain-containing protein [Candidatus Thorarchaeota archaeon]|nr:PHP domain-containing protein [Candidatus Thorarchaeota archaeon]
MVRARADLHTHSTFSDGTNTPAQLVKLADEMELGGIALTDHDSVNGLDEFMNAEASEELIRIPGVELSSEHQGREVHVLGYFVLAESTTLQGKLAYLRGLRQVRFPKMIEKLRDLGIEIDQEEIDEALNGVDTPGRPHLASLLKNKGVVDSTREAFSKYLGEGKPAYVKKERLSTIEAIEFLSEEGAVPVIAHPLTAGFPNLRRFLVEMKKAGLRGVESEYNYAPLKISASSDSVIEASRGLDLVHTGGSDYHGGHWMGSLGCATVPVEIIDKLKRIAMQHEAEA